MSDLPSWWADHMAEQIATAVAHYPFAADGLAELGIDPDEAVAEWPHAAMIMRRAAMQYAANVKDPDRTPTQIADRFRDIEKLAGTLSKKLEEVEHSYIASLQANKDEKARLIGRIENEAILGSFTESGFATSDWRCNQEARVAASDRYRTWKIDLHSIQLNLFEAANLARTTLPKGTKTARYPHHAPLILGSASLWERLTGREASAAKVSSKKRSDDRPAFVRFVGLFANYAGVPAPSRAQVETVLAPYKARRKNLP